MTADTLEAIVAELRAEANGLPDGGYGTWERDVLKAKKDTLRRCASRLAALVRAGGVPQPETTALDVRAKIFVLLSEIRQCINDDHLMAAQRKVQAIETFLQRARTHGADEKCSRCGETYPNHAPTCIHADYELETQSLRCSGWLASEELCPCPNHLDESLEQAEINALLGKLTEAHQALTDASVPDPHCALSVADRIRLLAARRKGRA